MPLPIKFSADIQAHIDAGHFTIYPKVWMRNKRIWIWTKGNTQTVGGACKDQAEAEEAAVTWVASLPVCKITKEPCLNSRCDATWCQRDEHYP